ncbi:MAG: cytochrome C biogenesis protein [Betaproteobacteria bacterium HGW-Betaproteobacteria-1]|nr:MAG: cytochrome C biogenesis protein [Betaproteobacteria bacterium HGW-Betaproteobacteria-1]
MSDAITLHTVSVMTVWMLGLSMGLTACTATCLPFMGTWMIGRGSGARLALRDTSAFLAGRVTAYSLLGAVAGAAGKWLADTLAGGIGHAVIGLAGIAAGAWLLHSDETHRSCGTRRAFAEAPPYAMGFALSMTPCVPLATLLAVCAQAGSTTQGAGYGLAFGFGAAVTPMLILLPLLGSFGQRLREGRPWLGLWARRGAALVLIAIGLRRLMLLA